MVARLTLDQFVRVQILNPQPILQPVSREPAFLFLIFCKLNAGLHKGFILYTCLISLNFNNVCIACPVTSLPF
jgi:hypothetical protein